VQFRPGACELARTILPSFDYNSNVPDERDIASATSQDTNSKGIPDECAQQFMDGCDQRMMSDSGDGDGSEFDGADLPSSLLIPWSGDDHGTVSSAAHAPPMKALSIA
jgi:hypothetical protein